MKTDPIAISNNEGQNLKRIFLLAQKPANILALKSTNTRMNFKL